MRFPVVACLLLGLATVAVAQTADPNTAHWNYDGKTGPLRWSKLDPAYRAWVQETWGAAVTRAETLPLEGGGGPCCCGCGCGALKR